LGTPQSAHCSLSSISYLNLALISTDQYVTVWF
jgi:hypothetical protein